MEGDSTRSKVAHERLVDNDANSDSGNESANVELTRQTPSGSNSNSNNHSELTPRIMSAKQHRKYALISRNRLVVPLKGKDLRTHDGALQPLVNVDEIAGKLITSSGGVT